MVCLATTLWCLEADAASEDNGGEEDFPGRIDKGWKDVELELTMGLFQYDPVARAWPACLLARNITFNLMTIIDCIPNIS